MELLKLSKFKLQIRALIAEVHQLNVRTNSSASILKIYVIWMNFSQLSWLIESIAGKRTLGKRATRIFNSGFHSIRIHFFGFQMCFCNWFEYMENWSVEIVFGNGKQKQKQTEEEFSRKITELHEELGVSNELRQKLERKVHYCYYYYYYFLKFL